MMVGYLNHHIMRHMVSLDSLCCISLIVVAGYTYCAIGALSFLNRLQSPTDAIPGLTSIPSTIKWLVSRQVGYSEEELGSPPPTPTKLVGVYENEEQAPGISVDDSQFVGFNGRCNKMVDTCYAFWVTGSLEVRV
jgi:geranylgeranyl transferase type-1 subunit beta